MYNTPYPEVNALLADLLAAHRHTLGDRLTGLYLFGSLVSGEPAGVDFDPRLSDVDLLAALAEDPDEATAEQLRVLHDDLAARYPAWAGRIEVIYLSVEGLRTYKTETRQGAVISPGEPFHLRDLDRLWLINWWVVREVGVPLWGPPPKTLIAPISRAEYIRAVSEDLGWWRGAILEGDNIENRRAAQAYVVLTMCRALYSRANGAQASKRAAAVWARAVYPAWAGLIDRAVVWRDESDNAPLNSDELAEVRRFVAFTLDQAG